MEDISILIVFVFIGLGIVLMRFIGAWMLRINDVIKGLEDVQREMQAFRMQIDKYRKEDQKLLEED